MLAINHLHSCGIVHRDIKPDNFLFKSKGENSQIKLIDFGLSTKLTQGMKLQTILGTPFYVAPEVIDRKGYTERCDIWSAGIMMYLCLVADFPFKADTNQELFDKIRKSDYPTNASDNMRKLSHEGKVLLKNLLEKNPYQRWSAREALRSPWFDSLNEEQNERGKKIVTS